jgi:hypothetical protein
VIPGFDDGKLTVNVPKSPRTALPPTVPLGPNVSPVKLKYVAVVALVKAPDVDPWKVSSGAATADCAETANVAASSKVRPSDSKLRFMISPTRHDWFTVSANKQDPGHKDK